MNLHERPDLPSFQSHNLIPPLRADDWCKPLVTGSAEKLMNYQYNYQDTHYQPQSI